MRQQVDLPTLRALEAEWAQHPPVHHLVAAYLGYKPPVHAPAQQVTDIEGLMQEIGSADVRKVPATNTSEFDAHMKELNKNG